MRVRVSAQMGVMTETPDSPLLRKPQWADGESRGGITVDSLPALGNQLWREHVVMKEVWYAENIPHIAERAIECPWRRVQCLTHADGAER